MSSIWYRMPWKQSSISPYLVPDQWIRDTQWIFMKVYHVSIFCSLLAGFSAEHLHLHVAWCTYFHHDYQIRLNLYKLKKDLTYKKHAFSCFHKIRSIGWDDNFPRVSPCMRNGHPLSKQEDLRSLEFQVMYTCMKRNVHYPSSVGSVSLKFRTVP